ncbi:hypothetical protein HY496_02205 [Candidatus Woesearchaeota archaeon]|nr:hypothetical protein [Candidatus Woesearchaeota archaeon]
MALQIGLEQELTLLSKEGMVSNRADDVLSRLRGDQRFVKEAQEYCVEVNTPPASTIAELDTLLRDALHELETAAEKENVFVAPVCYFGYGPIKVRDSARYQAYIPIIGDKNDALSNTIVGIHLHLDQVPTKLVEQQRILTALDPLAIAITSSSPLDYRGRNGINCQRMHLVRNVVFADTGLQCEPYYADSEEDIEQHDLQRYQQWGERWMRNTGRTYPEFAERFTSPQNTGYHSPRKRDNIGDGTWEVRLFDSTPRPFALAAVAAYKAIHDRVIEENLPVMIAAEDGDFSFTEERVVLPTPSTLQELTEKAIRSGIRDGNVAAYLANALAFADESLSAGEKIYLSPAAAMLSGRRMNFADQITSTLPWHKQQYNEREIAAANQFVREVYQKTL